jgi:DNA ligase (NAD+)
VTEADAANELMRLAKQIAYHNKRYHAEDTPEISDAEYDALIRRNNELRRAFPISCAPIAPIIWLVLLSTSGLKKITHAKHDEPRQCV